MIKIDIIIPSYHSEQLTTLAIKSFEKNKGNFHFRYIVVENGGDESYKDNIASLNDNIVWFTNDCKHSYLASETNAEAVTKGLELVESDLVFICHNDVVACHPEWMNFLYSKFTEGNSIVGTVLDNARINAVHISGLLTTTEIAKSISLYPVRDNDTMICDVGDTLTKYCRENNLEYFCCRNTHNDGQLSVLLDDKYAPFHVDRALNDNDEVIYMHLGRGAEKLAGNYSKPNRVYYNDWVEFVTNTVLCEVQQEEEYLDDWLST